MGLWCYLMEASLTKRANLVQMTWSGRTPTRRSKLISRMTLIRKLKSVLEKQKNKKLASERDRN